ncbi:MAG: alpha/beta hydrolase, partial [Saprospiraceae bacterium]|nr:alpha/beta hydrolase [Saprospiraceae bacterium]
MKSFVSGIVLFFLLSSNALIAQSEFDIEYNIKVDKPKDGVATLSYEIKKHHRYEDYNQKIETMSIDTFLKYLLYDISQLPDHKNKVLLYIHGMWGSSPWNFINSMGMIERAYLENRDSDIARIISMKWPGNNMDYKDNKSRVYQIADEIAPVMIQLIRTFQIVDIFNPNFDTHMDLICHSLGNELFKEIFSYLPTEQYDHEIFDQIILAAPDLDVGVFRFDGPLYSLPKIANGIHIYYSRKDLTLGVSKNLNKKERLGIYGPDENDVVKENMYFIDVSDVKDEANFGERLTGHSYYRSSKLATRDM